VAGVVVLALVSVLGLVGWRVTRTEPSVALPSPARSSTSGPSPSPTTSTAAPLAGVDYPAALAAFYTQSVNWEPCPGAPKHECTTVTVPVDYDHPNAEAFELALRKVPALEPDKRVGSMLVNPGGPGGSGVEYAQYSTFVFSKQVRDVYDVIGFDPRGIGASDAVTCLSDDDMDLLLTDDPTPDSTSERRKLLSDADTVARDCAQTGGKRALHMSTAEVARDMDIIRVLVGDKKLNYFGVSYGTFLGAMYADLFPTRVGRFVLDSAMSPNQTEAQEMTYDIQGFESSIDAFIAWCVKRSDCALGHSRSTARQQIISLLDSVERRPLRTTLGGVDRIGEGWVGFAIFMCLYSEASWPTLNSGLREAKVGRGDVLLRKAMQVVSREPSGEYGADSYLHAMLPVRCADWPRETADAGLLAARRKAQREHKLWARLTGELYDNCRAWPAPGRKPKTGPLAVGAAPILVIGNLRDPATPIGGTKQLASDLASGILVTSDHNGHGTYYAGNSCVDAIVDTYLIEGTVPSSDKAC
jgi:pimeloyl-ACP methyl ester carboxylesterase